MATISGDQPQQAGILGRLLRRGQSGGNKKGSMSKTSRWNLREESGNSNYVSLADGGGDSEARGGSEPFPDAPRELTPPSKPSRGANYHHHKRSVSSVSVPEQRQTTTTTTTTTNTTTTTTGTTSASGSKPSSSHNSSNNSGMASTNLRAKGSFRVRFRARTHPVPQDGEPGGRTATGAAPAAPAPMAIYVPRHAASDFEKMKNVASPPPATRQRGKSPRHSQSSDEDRFGHRSRNHMVVNQVHSGPSPAAVVAALEAAVAAQEAADAKAAAEEEAEAEAEALENPQHLDPHPHKQQHQHQQSVDEGTVSMMSSMSSTSTSSSGGDSDESKHSIKNVAPEKSTVINNLPPVLPPLQLETQAEIAEEDEQVVFATASTVQILPAVQRLDTSTKSPDRAVAAAQLPPLAASSTDSPSSSVGAAPSSSAATTIKSTASHSKASQATAAAAAASTSSKPRKTHAYAVVPQPPQGQASSSSARHELAPAATNNKSSKSSANGYSLFPNAGLPGSRPATASAATAPTSQWAFPPLAADPLPPPPSATFPSSFNTPVLPPAIIQPLAPVQAQPTTTSANPSPLRPPEGDEPAEPTDFQLFLAQAEAEDRAQREEVWRVLNARQQAAAAMHTGGRPLRCGSPGPPVVARPRTRAGAGGQAGAKGGAEEHGTTTTTDVDSKQRTTSTEKKRTSGGSSGGEHHAQKKHHLGLTLPSYTFRSPIAEDRAAREAAAKEAAAAKETAAKEAAVKEAATRDAAARDAAAKELAAATAAAAAASASANVSPVVTTSAAVVAVEPAVPVHTDLPQPTPQQLMGKPLRRQASITQKIVEYIRPSRLPRGGDDAAPAAAAAAAAATAANPGLGTASPPTTTAAPTAPSSAPAAVAPSSAPPTTSVPAPAYVPVATSLSKHIALVAMLHDKDHLRRDRRAKKTDTDAANNDDEKEQPLLQQQPAPPLALPMFRPKAAGAALLSTTTPSNPTTTAASGEAPPRRSTSRRADKGRVQPPPPVLTTRANHPATAGAAQVKSPAAAASPAPASATTPVAPAPLASPLVAAAPTSTRPSTAVSSLTRKPSAAGGMPMVTRTPSGTVKKSKFTEAFVGADITS